MHYHVCIYGRMLLVVLQPKDPSYPGHTLYRPLANLLTLILVDGAVCLLELVDKQLIKSSRFNFPCRTIIMFHATKYASGLEYAVD